MERGEGGATLRRGLTSPSAHADRHDLLLPSRPRSAAGGVFGAPDGVGQCAVL